jgi:cytochrome c6
MKIVSTIVLLIYIGCFLSFTQSSPVPEGKSIFDRYCVKCHGTDGTKGKWGAKNLQRSTLTEEDMIRIITNGKRIMPSWKSRLTEKNILQVISYIKSFKKLTS